MPDTTRTSGAGTRQVHDGEHGDACECEIITCAQCGAEVEREDAKRIDGDYYCEACVYTCDECGNLFPSESSDALCLGDYIYCGEDCASNSNWRQCEDCGEWTGGPGRRARSSYHVEGHGDVCESCLDNYYTCEDCGDLFRERDVWYDDGHGVYHCHGCRDEARVINDYSYKPRAILTKLAYENTCYLGLELEVECGNRGAQDMAAKLRTWLDEQKNEDGRSLGDYIYFKHDGSLSNGVELVFHPFTLKAFHKKFPLRKFMLKLKDMGFRGYQSGHCGLHVHISRAGFKNAVPDGHRGDAAHVGKVFFYKAQNYLKKFSRRRSFDYCHFDGTMPRDGFRQESGRYSAFNTSASARTFEVRIFRATIDYKRFMASVQFCDAFAQYIPERSLAFMINNTPGVIWADFLDFCKKSGKWSQFVKYILRNRIV